jgi:hypothetical protein
VNLPYAEDIGHYWQTGSSPPDTWIDKAKKVIQDMGGQITADGFGSAGGRAAFMLQFKIKENLYKVVWPVLPSSTGKDASAKRQAATLLYHDVKAKAMTASVLGAEVAFFQYMALPDGRVVTELARPELADAFPKLIGNTGR